MRAKVSSTAQLVPWPLSERKHTHAGGTSAARARCPDMELAFTVLFVDDDPQIRESIVQLLSLRGFRVLTAESAFEGLRVLTQEHVDVLFCDIVMPGMSGIELAKKARQLRPTLQIMFATGYAVRARTRPFTSASSCSSRCARNRLRPSCAS